MGFVYLFQISLTSLHLFLFFFFFSSSSFPSSSSDDILYHPFSSKFNTEEISFLIEPQRSCEEDKLERGEASSKHFRAHRWVSTRQQQRLAWRGRRRTHLASFEQVNNVLSSRRSAPNYTSCALNGPLRRSTTISAGMPEKSRDDIALR